MKKTGRLIFRKVIRIKELVQFLFSHFYSCIWTVLTVSKLYALKFEVDRIRWTHTFITHKLNVYVSLGIYIYEFDSNYKLTLKLRYCASIDWDLFGSAVEQRVSLRISSNMLIEKTASRKFNTEIAFDHFF